ncbi:ATP cone domain-containing protein [Candidatus Bathyarchaeota archaeon]|nr:ATP cone domain-containing protein [Candidatus Bathyarchaeota archaeon]
MSEEKKTPTKIAKPPTLKIMKRDGRMEEFVPEKIIVSIVKVGVPTDVARKIAKDIQSKVKEKISTAEIRKIVLENLRKSKPQWEQDWLIYERVVKKRTQ